MPYRRLPNTDKARLAALEKAVAMEQECDVDKQAASYKTLNEARALLRRFKSVPSSSSSIAIRLRPRPTDNISRI